MGSWNFRKSFASDNSAGAPPEILHAIEQVNRGHALAYGADEVTRALASRALEVFGDGAEIFPVLTGTGANTLSLAACARPHELGLVADSSHLLQSEAGAPERFSGAKLVAVAADPAGKISPPAVSRAVEWQKRRHGGRTRFVSVAQPTEMGALYSLSELADLARATHEAGAFFHVDGARIANAAAALGCSLRSLTRDAGADLVSFGATKNGLLFGEAILCFPNAGESLAGELPRIRQQGLQLASKLRFVSAQLLAYLEGELWLRLARHANRMAALLAERARAAGIEITRPTQTNAVFARIPRALADRLRVQWDFHDWDDHPERPEVRWMCAWDTEETEIEAFSKALRP